MSYSEDNKMFLFILNSIQELLNGTRFRITLNELKPPNDDAYYTDWDEYRRIKKNPAFETFRVDCKWWGQKIIIIDPTVQTPIANCQDAGWYQHGLITITENTNHPDRYGIYRVVSSGFDRISCDSNTEITSERFIKYEDMVDYIKNHLLNDLETLSDAAIQLSSLRSSCKKLCPLKYSKDDYYG